MKRTALMVDARRTHLGQERRRLRLAFTVITAAGLTLCIYLFVYLSQ